jgi:hypothetical protein
MTLLRNGGYTILWRHGQTDRSTSDLPGQNTERFQQRNLNDAGVSLAKSVGVVFKARGIPVGEVLASPLYRTMETAQYAFGRATKNPLLMSLDASPDERALIAVPPASGTNRVLVTHHYIIERDIPGIKPGDVNEGEAAIVKSDGKSLRAVAVIKVADWARFAADPAVQKATPASYGPPTMAMSGPVSSETAAMIHSGRGQVILSYLQSFNAGRDAMKAFLETNVVPDPNKTVAERLDAFDKLRADLGGFATITAANANGPDELSITTTTTLGKQVTIKFKQEAKTPYRAISISLQYAQHGG